MNMSDYLIESGRTVSDQFNYTSIPVAVLTVGLTEFIDVTKLVDKLKKTLFYGKRLDLYPYDQNEVEIIRVEETDPDKTRVDTTHAIMGLATEAGELVDLLVTPEEWPPRAKLVDEAGDILWYLGLLLRANGVTFEEVAEANIDKLKARFPQKFDQRCALNRNDEEEQMVFAAF